MDQPINVILHAQWEGRKEIEELRIVLDRAMNTWEPKDRPPWVDELNQRVAKLLGLLPDVPKMTRASLPPDHFLFKKDAEQERINRA